MSNYLLKLKPFAFVTVGVLSTLGALSLTHLGPVQAQSPGVNLAQLLARLTADEKTITALQTLTKPLTLVGTNLTISGVNVHIVDGTGSTTSTSGLGNLTIGYNLTGHDNGDIRTGSHNLIVGDQNNYSSYGGLIAGTYNTLSSPYASVSGGLGNTADGYSSSVSGGAFNTANGDYSSVSGGYQNTASGSYSSVSGGVNNTANNYDSSVSGGYQNTASDVYSSVSGGVNNTASGFGSSVSGGYYNAASALYSSVSGGVNNTASGDYSSMSGGTNITQSNESGWSGGAYRSP